MKQREQLFQLHDDMCARAKGIMEAKNQDYAGGSQDVYANFRGSIHFGVEPEVGIMVRIQDKFKRIEAFIKNGTLAVKDESWRDTLEDVINYVVLMTGMLEERVEKTELKFDIKWDSSTVDKELTDVRDKLGQINDVHNTVSGGPFYCECGHMESEHFHSGQRYCCYVKCDCGRFRLQTVPPLRRR